MPERAGPHSLDLSRTLKRHEAFEGFVSLFFVPLFFVPLFLTIVPLKRCHPPLQSFLHFS